MSSPDRYIPGVPCWVDTNQPDLDAAATFYAGLFGWQCEDVMPPGAATRYLIGRLGGGDVAAITSFSEGAPTHPVWNTYIRVENADETAMRVKEAGGTVLMGPWDVQDQGRMAVCADREGADFMIWEARSHRGSDVVNEPGSVNFNDLYSREPDAATQFYHAVFGWEILDLGPGGQMWTLPGYGDHLDRLHPGNTAAMAEMGAPAGFENVVASLNPISSDDADTQPHWGITFGVADADATAAKAVELGGKIVMPPTDAPWVRMSVLQDPAGAIFGANQFVPENS
ncbi:VOC family protein [Hoyosella subflava]|uniref:Glyoxalase/bleomycin resistance protein/dioxygenase n=1 Tax=Hoyosella subflava (strain DSM 45089 / JCM 17490 / NBRC 109087 / DQS3-9A1) TaxID=443218 RepID=F6ERW2_HOYSD|nr:VOC family protein [Hoyosella subflava]AEF40777.1 Glyoxalase/bleomycin resistance protein/dioxygenase [Hoyosella subflava DQS3-9A1]